jgi:hypothetical protein
MKPEKEFGKREGVRRKVWVVMEEKEVEQLFVREDKTFLSHFLLFSKQWQPYKLIYAWQAYLVHSRSPTGDTVQAYTAPKVGKDAFV